jgi:membrane fusion protein (multidrug efflux system)
MPATIDELEITTEERPAAQAPVPPEPKGRAWLLRGAAAVVLLIGLGYAGYLWWHGMNYESTDDAFVDGPVVQVSPRVAGYVARLAVADNQHLAAGDLILELDAGDYQTQLDQARGAKAAAQARLAAAEAQLAMARKTAPAALSEQQGGLAGSESALLFARAQGAVAESELAQARARLTAAQAGAEQARAAAGQAASDLRRYQEVFKTGGITASQLDQFATSAKTADAGVKAADAQTLAAEAGVVAAQEALQATKAQVEQAQGKVHELHGKTEGADVVTQKIAAAEAERNRAAGDLEQAAAAVHQAELNLSYTRITAACAGTITRKAVEQGDYIRPGQPLLALVSDERWVVANFKETQLDRMRPGQEVRIRIDAFPSLVIRGKVDSIQRGTGARFSLLPAENATGNYVKVVQRVPVKVLFDGPVPEQVPLGLGLSVLPEVKVR